MNAFRNLALGVGLAGLLAAAPVAAQSPAEQEAMQLGVEGYIYGYPLVTIEMTRRVATNVASAVPGATRAPMFNFARVRQYPDASYRDVTAPNADTLYSSAWVDVSREPYVLSLPDHRGRYFLMPMLSGWTDVFTVPGKRTTGTGAQKYAITGPGWKGKLPPGVREVKSPTGLVWILGRTYSTGTPQDYAAVHALQDKYDLRPLSAYSKAYTPPPGTVDPSVDMRTAVREQVHALDAGAYFKLLARLMKDNPPAAADAPMVAKLARIGVVPGQDFDIARLNPVAARGLAAAPKAAIQQIMGYERNAGRISNGWVIATKTGLYGTEYLQRALVTAIGLGANRPEDAVYPVATTDDEGKPLNGANRYVVHFPKGGLPPAKGFWSLTMYDANYFFVANPLNRYTLSPRNALKANRDGSVDLYIQADNPGPDKESNWLPAPKAAFVLMMRLYWNDTRKPTIIDGSWNPPPVKRVM